jgi:hypothetical protein
MFHLTMKSRNGKTGQMPVSTSGRETCPTTCPLKNRGCFGDNFPLSKHWNAVSRGDKRATDWSGFLTQVRDIAEGTIWRHNQVGDLPGEGNVIDGPSMFELIRANLGKRGFTYTHKPVTLGGPFNDNPKTIEDNRLLIWIANQHGFTVNLSADNPDHADELVELGIAPVTCLLPDGETRKGFTSKSGNSVLRCPKEYTDLTCKSCGLCARSNRKTVIGFTVHGSKAKMADIIAKGERSAK